jgi:hypothetical protein
LRGGLRGAIAAPACDVPVTRHIRLTDDLEKAGPTERENPMKSSTYGDLLHCN